eukprot:scpid105983/ scgid4351/ 
MASRICDVKEIEELLELGTFTWSWTENLESEVVNVQGGKSSSMRLRAETIQGRSTSLSGDDSDSEESELDASDVLAYAKEPEYTEDEIMQMASAEQVGVNADETAAAAADTDLAACLEECWPTADRVGTTCPGVNVENASFSDCGTTAFA